VYACPLRLRSSIKVERFFSWLASLNSVTGGAGSTTFGGFGDFMESSVWVNLETALSLKTNERKGIRKII
jgi:hypothetical protein